MIQYLRFVVIVLCLWLPLQAAEHYTVQQLTFGPLQHLFGFIGHAKTIPWNASGRYILAMRIGFDDHMPNLDDPADVMLLGTHDQFQARKVSQTRGWNF